MNDEKNCNCLEHINCEATHCVHNDEHNHCTASSIKVSSQSASCPGETACDTFQCR